MLKKLDRIAIVLVAAIVGVQAIIPGWTIMSDGSVYGFKLPSTILSGAWPFADFFVGGLLLTVVIGGGCLATAVINVFDARLGVMAGFVMGLVLIGWIAGELIFLTDTMVMTWIILGAGIVLVGLSAPYAVPEFRALLSNRRHLTAA